MHRVYLCSLLLPHLLQPLFGMCAAGKLADDEVHHSWTLSRAWQPCGLLGWDGWWLLYQGGKWGLFYCRVGGSSVAGGGMTSSTAGTRNPSTGDLAQRTSKRTAAFSVPSPQCSRASHMADLPPGWIIFQLQERAANPLQGSPSFQLVLNRLSGSLDFH